MSPTVAKPRSLINDPVDTSRLRILTGYHPLWANADNDSGLLPDNRAMEDLTLVLARPAELEEAFNQFLDDQQNPASPQFHHWFTPEEVGERFGPSEEDISAITGWLQSQGLHVNWTSPSKIFIGFGGTAFDVGRAFQTELHAYKVNGKDRISVSSDPTIPEAVAPAVAAIRGLYTIEEMPFNRTKVQPMNSPEATYGSSHYVSPGDFDLIYDVPAAYTGAGVTIGIVGRSRVYPGDLTAFKTLTGVTIPTPTVVVPPGGTDPLGGCSSTDCDDGDQGEATLDVIRAGSVAPAANLLLVVTTASGGDVALDAQYLVNSTPVPAQIMSISFGDCEAHAGSSAVTYWDNLFKTAAGEGISVFVSSGDSGAAGCETSFAAPPSIGSTNSPNAFCSSSYATCVGGTEFADTSSPATYWNTTNSTGLVSARSYIPEGAWNESTASSVAGSGGGVSSFIATPTWQKGVTGVPSGYSGRYTPDISFSSSLHDGYLGCFAAEGADCTQYITEWAGTSASAPGMAGIAALLVQKTGSAQGNLNPNLYSMFSSAPSAFHDTTVASSGVSPCSATTISLCNTSTPTSSGGVLAGFVVGTGFDEATGLGSLDVSNFLNNFGTVLSISNLTLSTTQVATGQSVTVTLTLSGSAPAGGTAVALASSNTTAFPVPSSCTVPAGQTSGSCSVTAGTVSGSASVTVTATLNGVALQASLMVFPTLPTISSFTATSAIASLNPATLSITLSAAAPTGGMAVTLTSSNPAVLPVTSPFTITAGQGTASTTATATTVTTPTSVTLTASYNNSTKQATVTVNPLAVTGISISPSPLITGYNSTVTISLNGNPPTGGVAVSLTSSNPTAFPVPATCNVNTGTSQGACSVIAGAVSTATSVTVTATYNGSSQQTSVTINPVIVSSVGISPATVTSGQTSTITVRLNTLAPSGGAAVNLSSSNTAAFPTPATCTVAAGQASGSCTVTAGTVSTTTNVTITATYNGGLQQTTVTVNPGATAVGSVGISPSAVYSGGSATVTVSLSAAAPTGGANVALSSTNTTAFPVPATCTVAAGQTSASCNTTAGTVTTSTSVTITATYNGSSQQASVAVNPLPTIGSLCISPSSVSSGGSATITVTLSGAAPVGGAAVTLSSSNSSALPVPATCTVSAGQTAASCTATAGMVTTSTNVTVTATYNGSSQQASITVTAPKVTPTVTVTPASSSITTTQILSVTTTVSGGTGAPMATGSVTLSSGSYTSSAATLSGGSVTISIPAGSLALGSDTLAASYTPDSSSSSTFNSASGASSAVTVSKATPTVTVTPGLSSITTAQALSVTITVNGGSGVSTPTGSVILTGGGYTSAAATLISGGATINIPAGKLATGSDTLVVAYTPDSASSSIYNSASGTSTAVTVTQPAITPTVSVTPSATSITTTQALTVTVAVSGGTGNPVPTGSVVLSSGSYNAQQALASGSTSFTIAAGTFGSGTITLTANYSGDANYTISSSTTTITVEPVSITTPAPSPVNPGSSTTSTVTLTGSSGYSGTMNLTCVLTSSPTAAQSLPTCALNPASVTITSGGTGTSTLTVYTTAASTTALAQPTDRHLWKFGSGGAVLAALLLFGIPFRRRRWVSTLILLLAFATGAIGCGGGSSGGGGGSSTPATTAGNYSFTVAATDSVNAKITASTTISVTVQ